MKKLISGISMAVLGLSLVTLPVFAAEEAAAAPAADAAAAPAAAAVELEVKDGKCLLKGTETVVTVKDGKVMAGEEDKGAAPAEVPDECKAK